jgi:hypothetical protein
MTTPAEYQSYAQECLRWAAEADNEKDRQALLELAKVWTQLALHAPKGKQAGPTTPSTAPYQQTDNPELG